MRFALSNLSHQEKRCPSAENFHPNISWRWSYWLTNRSSMMNCQLTWIFAFSINQMFTELSGWTRLHTHLLLQSQLQVKCDFTYRTNRDTLSIRRSQFLPNTVTRSCSELYFRFVTHHCKRVQSAQTLGAMKSLGDCMVATTEWKVLSLNLLRHYFAVCWAMLPDIMNV